MNTARNSASFRKRLIVVKAIAAAAVSLLPALPTYAETASSDSGSRPMSCSPSTNGPGGGPVDLPSAPFSTQYQAGLIIDNIAVSTNGLNILFAAPSSLPDNAGPGTVPATYTLQSSPTLGADANWQKVGDAIAGDDFMHTINVPMTGSAQFFRLSAYYPASN